MVNFFKDNLGYELADCICGGRPELVSMCGINTIGYCPYLYFTVKCPKCGRTAGLHVDEADAVFHWNRYIKTQCGEFEILREEED